MMLIKQSLTILAQSLLLSRCSLCPASVYKLLLTTLRPKLKSNSSSVSPSVVLLEVVHDYRMSLCTTTCATPGVSSGQAAVQGVGVSAVGEVHTLSLAVVSSWGSLTDLRDNELTPLPQNSGYDPVVFTPQLFSGSDGSSDLGCLAVSSVHDGSNVVGHGAVAPSSVNNGVVSHGASGPMHPGNCSGTSSISSVPRAVSHEASGSMRPSGADSVTINDYC